MIPVYLVKVQNKSDSNCLPLSDVIIYGTTILLIQLVIIKWLYNIGIPCIISVYAGSKVINVGTIFKERNRISMHLTDERGNDEQMIGMNIKT